MSAQSKSLDRTFRQAFVINSSFMLFEFVVGILTGSLILIADAAHNLTDSITLVISWIGNHIAGKPADKNHTLGHGRISVLTAFINSAILFGMSIVIFVEAYHRFRNPQILEGSIIAVVSAVGIFANGSVALLFRKHRDDLNARAAFINMVFDAVFSVVALISGIVIYFTNWSWVVPLASIGVGIGLLWAAWGIIREATNIFLEGVPGGMHVDDIRALIHEHDDIVAVNELYVWAMSSEQYAMSCRITTRSKTYADMKTTTQSLKSMLRARGFSKIIIETT
jgi:cobalt-zinc-cadmium efflux system protein